MRRLGAPELTALFVFSTSEPGSSFEWSPERTSPTTCRPPASQLVLEPGPHTFEVWVSADAANAGAAATAHTWTIAAAKRDTLNLLAYASKGGNAQ